MTNIPTGPAIAVTGLRRSYGSQVALDGIDRGAIALGWCAVIALVGYVWANRLYTPAEPSLRPRPAFAGLGCSG